MALALLGLSCAIQIDCKVAFASSMVSALSRRLVLPAKALALACLGATARQIGCLVLSRRGFAGAATINFLMVQYRLAHLVRDCDNAVFASDIGPKMPAVRAAPPCTRQVWQSFIAIDRQGRPSRRRAPQMRCLPLPMPDTAAAARKAGWRLFLPIAAALSWTRFAALSGPPIGAVNCVSDMACNVACERRCGNVKLCLFCLLCWLMF